MFDLFWQCLSYKTYHFKGKTCSGGNGTKMRLTKKSAASAAGEKLPMLEIGKSKNYCCFKNVKSLLYPYKAQ